MSDDDGTTLRRIFHTYSVHLIAEAILKLAPEDMPRAICGFLTLKRVRKGNTERAAG
jgi:hypothetical protein